MAQGANPRFVVTARNPAALAGPAVYEQEYGGRGDREHRIKEQQLMLLANRVSCSTMRANQVRLCLATVAYSVLRALRQFGLTQTELAQAQAATMRVKLLQLGAVVRVRVRKVWLSLAESYPLRPVFGRAVAALRQLAERPLALAGAGGVVGTGSDTHGVGKGGAGRPRAGGGGVRCGRGGHRGWAQGAGEAGQGRADTAREGAGPDCGSEPLRQLPGPLPGS